MKFIEITNFDPREPQKLPRLLLATDSSIVSGRRPVFTPEFSERWKLAISVAYRISRLGKSIPVRFAPRYFDAMTLTARLIPLDLEQRLEAQGLSSSSPLATAFDGAIALGEWTDPKEDFSVSLLQPEAADAHHINPNINQSLSFISSNFILKTGDVIVAGDPIFFVDTAIGDHVEASIDGKEVLAYNIK